MDRILRHILFAGMLLALIGCTAGAQESTPTTAPQAAPTVVAPTLAAPSPTLVASTPTTQPTETPSGPTYTNPVYSADFPDPHVILVGDTYYAYSTNVSPANIPVISSQDLTTWKPLGDALPILPNWASPNHGLTWAPGVMQIGEKFVMYHVSRDVESDLQCIGAASADSPEGPFMPVGEQAFVCQTELGGSIDAYPFRDADGKLYLYWKNDGNCCGKTVGLWVQPLSDDGLTLTGQPAELIRMDQPWERPLIENPAMVLHEDDYFLFYSANWWESHEYAVGYAVCQSVTGPCEKPEDGPIFEFTPEVMGPGGQAFFTDEEGNLWMAYHAWTGTDIGYPAGQRSFRIDPAGFSDDEPADDPAITGPTSSQQVLP